jgi:membrane-associated phospholipid phosphatase
MLALKLAFLACGDLVAGNLHSPSGHTASAAAAFGGFAGLVARLRTGNWRWTIPLAAAVAVAVGLSRLALGVHTPLEVVIAGIVGVLGATALVAFAGRPPNGLRLRPLLATMVFVSLLFHGFHLPAEAAIRDFAALHFWPLSACLDTR